MHSETECVVWCVMSCERGDGAQGCLSSPWGAVERVERSQEVVKKKTPDRSKHDHPHLEGLERLSPSQGVSMLLHLRSEILGSSEL